MAEGLSDIRTAAPLTNIRPDHTRIRGSDGQPAGHTLSPVPYHIHRVAPVSLIDIIQAALIPLMQQPLHRTVDMLMHRPCLQAARIRYFLIQNAVIIRLIQVGTKANRQPDTMVRMRNLIDIFQFSRFMQNNAVRHRSAGLLLA